MHIQLTRFEPRRFLFVLITVFCCRVHSQPNFAPGYLQLPNDLDCELQVVGTVDFEISGGTTISRNSYLEPSGTASDMTLSCGAVKDIKSGPPSKSPLKRRNIKLSSRTFQDGYIQSEIGGIQVFRKMHPESWILFMTEESIEKLRKLIIVKK